jgi:feruloyl-CoA synthase
MVAPLGRRPPNRVFIAERSGDGWRQEGYGATLDMVRAVAASLSARGLGPDKTIVALSGPGGDHGILTLAAQYIGAPIVPLAEQYSLIPDAYPRLIYTMGKVNPSMIYASNSDAFGPAMALPELAGIEKVVSTGSGDGFTDFAELLMGQPGPDLDIIFCAGASLPLKSGARLRKWLWPKPAEAV